ncbi:MAG: hypothetical protein PF690_12470 [Deltaproteobacteria bacterium]|jgi:hypothetical protein|nr:hypothetical protein [Deltaproteobacteria bacterium]
MDRNTRLNIIEKLIKDERVCSFKQIFQRVECSSVTLRRDVKVIDGITSFTHGGEFITLSMIPSFNENGIWFYKKVGFTKFKNSLDLIVNVINSRENSITKETLDKILGIDVYKQIHVLLGRHQITRVKIGKKYHYLPASISKNRKKRLGLLNANNIEEYYDAIVSSSDLVALLKAILVEKKIKIDVKNLKRFTKKYSLKIPLNKIEQLLLKYNLTEKKMP